MKYPFLELKSLNKEFEDELKEAAYRVIESGRYLHGEQTERLEAELGELTGGAKVVTVSNGLDALRLILRGYIQMGRLAPGDEVIVPANTYIASVLAISDAGLVPVLAEPSPVTYNLDFNCVEKLITDKTRCLMTVHLFGTPAWNQDVMQRMRDMGILVVEDNAQAIGADAGCAGFNSTSVTGGLGDAAGFSFYPTKNVGALGDAGAVASFDEELIATVRALANYGGDRRYHNKYIGFNCRMDELQAAFLRVKMRHIDAINSKRRRVASIYDSEIKNPLVVKPNIFADVKQVWHQYVVRTPHRDAFMKYMERNGVGTDIHYAVPPHRQPCYKFLSHVPLPVTERLASEIVSLPIGSVNEKDVSAIAEIINAFTLD